MRNKLTKIALAVLGLAITIFLSCSDYPPLRFPSEEDMLSRAVLFSSSSEPSSSSVVPNGSSSSSDESSSSTEPSSSSEPPSSSGVAPSSSSAVTSSSSLEEAGSNSSSSSLAESSSSGMSCGEANKCGGQCYDKKAQFCHNGSKVGDFCGINPQKSYNPDLYECKSGKNGIYLKGGLTDSRYGNKHYDAVLIGTQVWMAENLNYDAEGSKCYDNSEDNCTTYGKLYNWMKAMALPAECLSGNCDSQIVAQHQGICPTGWHIPSDVEWKVLMQYVAPACTPTISTGCINMSTLLKTTSGWDDFNGKTSNGTDAYGFAALPGGIGNFNGSFSLVGNDGNWWSAVTSTQNNAYVMLFNSNAASLNTRIKNSSISVRCVKNN